jgi:hypothetical protein
MAASTAPLLTIEQAIEYSAQTANGDDTYSNDKALFGYIPTSDFLVLPTNYNPKNLGDMSVRDLGKQNAYLDYVGEAANAVAYRAANEYIDAPTNLIKLKITLLNYVNLRGTIPDIAPAFYVCQLRLRWIMRRFLYSQLVDRKVTYDEVRQANPAIQIEKAINDAPTLAALTDLGNTNALVKEYLEFSTTHIGLVWIKHSIKYAETWWAITEFLMRTKGHHFKQEYTDVITKAFRSVSENNVDFEFPAWYHLITRVAIHPFGLKALVLGTYNSVAFGKLGNGLILRLSGAPNGFAAITTASAGISMLKTEFWYNEFEKTYKNSIVLIDAMAKQMIDDKYAYHLAANLYGVVPKRVIKVNNVDIDMARADMAVTAVAGVIQGYIVWSRLKTEGKITFSFGNAKSLEKRCQTNPTMVQKIVALLDLTMTTIEDSDSIAEATRSVFATIANVAEKGPIIEEDA